MRFLQIFAAFLLGIMLSGCLYPNECGLSPFYYDKKSSYYDSMGNYIERCPETNVYDYKEDFGIEHFE